MIQVWRTSTRSLEKRSNAELIFDLVLGFLIILVLFAISNGYLTALLMMRAITEKNLHPEEVDVASSIMLIYLTAGVCLGAILSVVSFLCLL